MNVRVYGPIFVLDQYCVSTFKQEYLAHQRL